MPECGYIAISRHPSLSETVGLYVPGHPWTNEECLALIAEAKARCPEYVSDDKERAQFMRWYLRSKLDRR